MKLIGGLIGGLVGALIGAAAWAAIAYYTHYEIGIIAWGVGVVTGAGVLVGSAREGGLPGGVIAVVLALLGIAGGKYATIHFSVERELAKHRVTPSETVLVAGFADAIVEEREAAGKKINWPNAKAPDERLSEEDYPKDVWAEANASWQKHTPQEREQALQNAQAQADAALQTIAESVKRAAFKDSFGLFDVLWLFLAAASAYKLGAGAD